MINGNLCKSTNFSLKAQRATSNIVADKSVKKSNCLVVGTSSEVDISSHVKRSRQIQGFGLFPSVHRLQVTYAPCVWLRGSHTLSDHALCKRMEHSKKLLLHHKHKCRTPNSCLPTRLFKRITGMQQPVQCPFLQGKILIDLVPPPPPPLPPQPSPC